MLIETNVGESEDKDRKLPVQLRQLRKNWAGQGHCLQLGDAMVLLQAVIAAERAGYDQESLASLGLRYKAMQEIRRLRRQLVGEVRQVVGSDQWESSVLQAPDQSEARLLQQLLLAGSPYMVARRISKEEEQLDK